VFLSTLVTSLPLAFEQAVRCIEGFGFEHVDVVGVPDRPLSHREALAETHLVVSCAAVGRDLPAGLALDSESHELRNSAVAIVKRHIDDAAGLGATVCYVVAGMNPGREALLGFGNCCELLAEHARQRMVHLCVEHVPGRALPTAASVLDWLAGVRHSNLYLLLDIGHCQITQECAAGVVERAGDRLGYVHLDDNDGKNDLHLPLLKGLLQERDLHTTLAALGRINYQGSLCLELNAANKEPERALSEGRELVMRLMEECSRSTSVRPPNGVAGC
jgi:sugar phosphate isomerase/epimerase